MPSILESVAVQEVEAGVRTSLNVVSHLDLKFGGITAAMPGFCRGIALTGRWHSRTVATCASEEDSPFSDTDGDVVRLPCNRLKSILDTSFEKSLAPLMEAADVIHIHGIWEGHCSTAARIARAMGKPYVVSAHGMLEPWALRNKAKKKALYANLIERNNLAWATSLHATTLAEVENYRQFGLDRPVGVVPLGIDVPSIADERIFRDKFPQLADKRIVLFLSRIHYKKGLDILCHSWSLIRKQFPDVHLVLAGPDSENVQQNLEALIGQLGIGDSVTFTGMISGALKWSALEAAEVFVLPSHSENFGVAISEAMAMAKPVIITRQCNRPEVEHSKSGWVIEPDVHQLAAALTDCLSMPRFALAQIGLNGKHLIESSYSVASIGRQMSRFYDWILGGPTPEFVHFADPEPLS